MESDHEIEQIATIDRELPLTERLITALGYVTSYQNRLWTVAQAVHAAGVDMQRARREENGPPKSMVRLVNTIADLFGAERDTLRVEPVLAARLLLGLTFTNRMQGVGMGEVVADAEELVDFFLHGTQGRKKA
jgi:hypothetical protein